MNTTNTESISSSAQKIILGGGCFWCLDPVFKKIPGVTSVTVGYAGGDTKNPKYGEVCSGTTGHAEVLEISFDSEITSLEHILKVFFLAHDPTTLNQQGADRGTQYRSIILYENNDQMITANQVIDSLNQTGAWPNNIVTEVVPLEKFYSAEDYHQDYFNKNPEQSYCQLVIAPKLEKLKGIIN
jgi:methionine-S-sulfoxide reductase